MRRFKSTLPLYYRYRWIARLNEFIGWALWKAGKRPSVSTGIHDGLTYGYGALDDNGFWQFPVRHLED